MIVKNIEALCKERKISFNALEKSLGFGNSTISKWETSSPTVERLAKVADFFGVTVDFLLREERHAETETTTE